MNTDGYLLVAGPRVHQLQGIEQVVAEHYRETREHSMLPPTRGRRGADAGPTRVGAMHAVVRCQRIAELGHIIAQRGEPTAILLQTGGDEDLAYTLATLAAERELPMVLYMDDRFEALGDLQRVMRIKPTAVFVQAATDRLPGHLRSVLRSVEASCASGRLLAAFPPRGDRVTQTMLTHAVVGSRSALTVSAMAEERQMTPSAVRVRFAQCGLVAPIRLLAGTRALQALWCITERGMRTEVVAQRLKFGTEKNLLQRLSCGTGRSLRSWQRDGGFDAALQQVLERVVT
jgi:AraC-like DNA-binding protein